MNSIELKWTMNSDGLLNFAEAFLIFYEAPPVSVTNF